MKTFVALTTLGTVGAGAGIYYLAGGAVLGLTALIPVFLLGATLLTVMAIGYFAAGIADDVVTGFANLGKAS